VKCASADDAVRREMARVDLANMVVLGGAGDAGDGRDVVAR
jgi:hypothetical protein